MLVIGENRLLHRLGNIKSIQILGGKIRYTNHNYVRRYYITRNRLYVIWHYFFSYPLWCMKEIRGIFLDGIKIILFEKDKLKKVRSILMGVFDFARGRYGKVKF